LKTVRGQIAYIPGGLLKGFLQKKGLGTRREPGGVGSEKGPLVKGSSSHPSGHEEGTGFSLWGSTGKRRGLTRKNTFK